MPDGLIPYNERAKYRSWWRAFQGMPRWWGLSPEFQGQRYRTDDPFYQTWTSLGKPSAEEWLSRYEPTERKFGGAVTRWQTKTQKQLPTVTVEDIEAFLARPDLTAEELESNLRTLITSGQMTQENAANLFDWWTERQAEPEKEPLRRERHDRATDIVQGQNIIASNPAIQAIIQRYPMVTNTEGKQVPLMDLLMQNYINYGDKAYFNVINQAQRELEVETGKQKQQMEVALRSVREPFEELFQPAAEPTRMAEQTISETLGETALAPGTKLRSYIESQMAGEIPGLYESTREAREDWIRRMRQPWPTEQTEREALERELAKWQSVAGTAPSAESIGTTYFGPGGLKGLAERAAETARERLGSLRPEEFEARPEEEDPFAAALRRAFEKRKWLPEYHRQPGTGLVSRLTPAVRF